VIPLSHSLDHAGPMARSLADCVPLLAAMADVEPGETRPLRRVVVSPRIAELDPDVDDGFAAALSALDAEVVELAPPDVELDLGTTYLDVACTEMLAYHRRFAGQRELYRPSIRGFLEYAENRAMTAEEYAAAQWRRLAVTDAWEDWFAEHRIDAVVEPTLPIVAHARGQGYAEAFTDFAEISLTHYWDWTGSPAVALPSGVGSRSGLPTSVSLIGPAGSEWSLLAAGADLEERLGPVAPPSFEGS
jgi:Asp-tRNA(Asn)/Glu-tRNA(Gln) amidotransferase A subunit family amidase